MTLTLHQRISNALDSTGSLEDHIVAEAVVKDLSKKKQKALLLNIVQTSVSSVRAERTRRAIKAVTNPRLVGVSAHGMRVRSNWETFCAQSLSLGNGTRILIGDATVLDLRKAAERRRAQANALMTEADRWDKIAEALNKSGFTHVKDLPPQVI